MGGSRQGVSVWAVQQGTGSPLADDVTTFLRKLTTEALDSFDREKSFSWWTAAVSNSLYAGQHAELVFPISLLKPVAAPIEPSTVEIKNLPGRAFDHFYVAK